MEEASQAWAETEAVFVGGRRLSGVSNGRRKWAQAEEVSIGPRAEVIHLSGGGGIPCWTETEVAAPEWREGGGRRR